ncbi:MAG: hypothetical protein JNL21_38110 [Myxococcales bacterium]|nr:hypothetical protein [Myxococcales bacterium]
MLATALLLSAGCVPLAGGPSTFEDRQPCPEVALTLPPSDPALGGYDAGPGPVIGESQPLFVTYQESCYPNVYRFW